MQSWSQEIIQTVSPGRVYVLAVSGGVDSVVLLDILRQCRCRLIVAHFDHGMRPESAGDARFVEALAGFYGLEFVTKREELGDASEERARERRYSFLLDIAKKYKAELVTAHHLDDLVETVVINLTRGTGWRGLAGMSDNRILRPLLKRTKGELIEYALERRLEWCEDETNALDGYTRNRLRKKMTTLPQFEKLQVYQLWQSQLRLRGEIRQDIVRSNFPIDSRYFLTMIDEVVARELIYDFMLHDLEVSLLGSQVSYLLMAIKVGRPGTIWQIGQGVKVRLFKRDWRAEICEK